METSIMRTSPARLLFTLVLASATTTFARHERDASPTC
jgi:hypothetical protein